jgi:hypothetical protein
MGMTSEGARMRSEMFAGSDFINCSDTDYVQRMQEIIFDLGADRDFWKHQAYAFLYLVIETHPGAAIDFLKEFVAGK